MRKLWFAAPAILAAAVFLTTASVAQTTSPGRNPPPQTTPPPQVQVPIQPPRIATAPNPGEATVPVFIQWREGGRIQALVGLRPPPTGPVPPTFPEPDHDGDGYPSIARGGTDCDDNNGAVSPGRTEVVDLNGLDEDCNSLTIGVRDHDGDGFTSWRANQVLLSGTTPFAVVRGPDCDDSRRDVSPNAPEVLGDGRDNDCDGVIDRIVEPGHRGDEYCGPTQRVAARHAADFPCGEARR
jgi:hypothetical protein